MPIEPILYRDGTVELIDQRRLPDEFVTLRITDVEELAAAIREMAIRGAPSIGVAAAYGVVLGMRGPSEDRWTAFRRVKTLLAETRPTAVNLTWALERMQVVFDRNADGDESSLREALEREAQRLHEEEVAANRRIGRLGVRLVPPGGTVLTHCNTGALATAGYGTALGIVRTAWEDEVLAKVFVDETASEIAGRTSDGVGVGAGGHSS